MGNLNYLVAIGGGIASFISPCVLPMVPVYLAIISGVSIDDMKTGKASMGRVLFAALLFILGFSVVFAMLGLAVGILASSFYKAIFNLVLGTLIIFFGLHYTGILRIHFLDREKRFRSNKGGALKAFVVGFLFAFGWTPCIGPILGSILALPAEQMFVKMSYTLAYSMGLAIPFLFSALAINSFYKLFDRIKHHFHKIEIGIGILLIGLGIYYVVDVLRSGDLTRKTENLVITDAQRKLGVNFPFVLSGNTNELKHIPAKVYLINVWTTWCPNCIKEIPDLSAIYEKYKKSGVYIMGICLEDADSTQTKYQELIKKLAPKNPMIFDNGAKIGRYLKAFYPPSGAINAFPVTYILDANRQVVHFQPGALHKEDWIKLLKKYASIENLSR